MKAKKSVETVESVEAVEVPAPQPVIVNLNTDPGLLAQLFERHTATGQSALRPGKLFRTRTLTFTIDGADCEPGIFEDADGKPYDFTITMRGLTPAEELEVLAEAQGAGTPHVMAGRQLHRVNGTLINREQRLWLWNALGSKGRSICIIAGQSLCNPTVTSQGKYLASITVGSE